MRRVIDGMLAVVVDVIAIALAYTLSAGTAAGLVVFVLLLVVVSTIANSALLVARRTTIRRLLAGAIFAGLLCSTLLYLIDWAGGWAGEAGGFSFGRYMLHEPSRNDALIVLVPTLSLVAGAISSLLFGRIVSKGGSGGRTHPETSK